MIDKSVLLTDVNKICKRSETSIDAEILKALREISNRTLVLKTSASGTTTAGVAYITKPTGFTDHNIIDGFSVNNSELKPISWPQYLSGNFQGYCVYGDNIYFYPSYTSTVPYTIYFPRVHPNDVDTILLPDSYEEALKHLVASKVYEKYERYDEVSAQLTLYESALGKVGTNPTPPICTAPQEI